MSSTENPPRTPEETYRAQLEQHQKFLERYHRENFDFFIRINGAMYSSAMAYTNAVVIAGYVAFFAIWSYTKEFIPPWAMQATAALMGASALVFVAFEIYKMIETYRAMETLMPVLKVEPSEASDAISRYQVKLDEMRLRLIHAQWPALFFSVATGFGAGLLLFAFFIRDLFLS